MQTAQDRVPGQTGSMVPRRIPLGLFDATFSLASCRRWTCAWAMGPLRWEGVGRGRPSSFSPGILTEMNLLTDVGESHKVSLMPAVCCHLRSSFVQSSFSWRFRATAEASSRASRGSARAGASRSTWRRSARRRPRCAGRVTRGRARPSGAWPSKKRGSGGVWGAWGGRCGAGRVCLIFASLLYQSLRWPLVSINWTS